MSAVRGTKQGLSDFFFKNEFHCKINGTASAHTNEVFTENYNNGNEDPVDRSDTGSTNDLPAPGDDYEYRITAIHVCNAQASASVLVSILNVSAGTPVWRVNAPVGVGIFNFPLPGLRVGENKQLLLTTSAALTANGRVDIFGVKVPVGS